MMNKKFSLALLFLSLLVIGACSDSDAKPTVSLMASDSLLTLKLDDNTSNISAFLAHYHDDEAGEMLFSLNPIKNEIQVYDLGNQELIKQLTFDLEGDRGVGNIAGFYVHNLDSIFLFPNNGNRLYLTNSEADEISRIDYDVADGYGNAQVTSNYFSGNAYLYQGRLLTKTLYQGNYSTINNQELSTKHLSASIDLEAGMATNLLMTYPDDYMSEVKKHFQFSLSASANGIVYSLWADHHLYLVKPSDTEPRKVLAQSEYLRASWEPLPLGGDRVDRARYFAASAHYGNVLYDPYREVYYRFVYPKVEIEDEPELRQLALYPAQFSVMILDKELNVLGETFFEDGFVTSNAFVGEEGLYLSINHPENEENREDYLSFKLFSLKGYQ